jgi:hypothetical protein
VRTADLVTRNHQSYHCSFLDLVSELVTLSFSMDTGRGGYGPRATRAVALDVAQKPHLAPFKSQGSIGVAETLSQ